MSGGGTHCLQGAGKKLAAAYHGADDIRRVAPDQAEPVSQRRRRASKPRDGGSVGKDSGAGSLAGILLGGRLGDQQPTGDGGDEGWQAETHQWAALGHVPRGT